MYNVSMTLKIGNFLNNIAKVFFIVAVIASLVFLGWRAATKRAYSEREEIQCVIFAASAAATAADALANTEGLLWLVKESGQAIFVADHKKMPRNFVVTLTMAPSASGFTVTSKAMSGWNSRAPKSIEITATADGLGGITIESLDALADNAKYAELAVKESRNLLIEKRADGKNEHIFTYPNERPCPVPFKARSAKTTLGGALKEPLYILAPQHQDIH